MLSFTAIYSQNIENRGKFFVNFFQKGKSSRGRRLNSQDRINSLGVIRLKVLGLNSFAYSTLNKKVVNITQRTSLYISETNI